MKPKFNAGKNIAMKVPAHEFEKTAIFYRDILGLECLSDVMSHTESSIRYGLTASMASARLKPGCR